MYVISTLLEEVNCFSAWHENIDITCINYYTTLFGGKTVRLGLGKTNYTVGGPNFYNCQISYHLSVSVVMIQDQLAYQIVYPGIIIAFSLVENVNRPYDAVTR